MTRGELFDVPAIGPHHHMWRTVGPGRSGTDFHPLTDVSAKGEPPEL